MDLFCCFLRYSDKKGGKGIVAVGEISGAGAFPSIMYSDDLGVKLGQFSVCAVLPMF